MADDKKCAHEICECKVSGDKEYCSDTCKNASDGGAHTACHCGHSGCKH